MSFAGFSLETATSRTYRIESVSVSSSQWALGLVQAGQARPVSYISSIGQGGDTFFDGAELRG